MSKSLDAFKSRALARHGVKRAHAALDDEFQLLDEILKARQSAGLSQAQLAKRIGTTQSAVARMEPSSSRHSPSIFTLKRYASALGYRVRIRLVRDLSRMTPATTRTQAKQRVAS